MEKKRAATSESTHIKEVLRAILRDCRTETHGELSEIRKIWNAVVDQTVAEHAQPTALKGSVLLVTVKSSTVSHQLRFLTRNIIAAVNRSFSRRITEIKIKTGTF